jgi:hypothetical protein
MFPLGTPQHIFLNSLRTIQVLKKKKQKQNKKAATWELFTWGEQAITVQKRTPIQQEGEQLSKI